MASGITTTIKGYQPIVGFGVTLPKTCFITFDPGQYNLVRRYGTLAIEGYRISDNKNQFQVEAKTIWTRGGGFIRPAAYAAPNGYAYRLVGYWKIPGILYTWFWE